MESPKRYRPNVAAVIVSAKYPLFNANYLLPVVAILKVSGNFLKGELTRVKPLMKPFIVT